MNNVILIGRLTSDPTINHGNSTIARYTLAVDRRFKRDGQPTADFIPCVAFGKTAEFVENYLRKGTKIAVSGRIQTGSYTNKDGAKVYTTDVIAESHEFVDSRASGSSNANPSNPAPQSDTKTAEGFMSIPEGIGDELPFV